MPRTEDVTFTEIVHVAGAAPRLPPESAIAPLPAVAVTVPPHELVTPGVPATTMLVGSVSVKARPEAAGAPAPLVSVKVATEVAPGAIDVGEKAFVSAEPLVYVTVEVAPAADTPVESAEKLVLLLVYAAAT